MKATRLLHDLGPGIWPLRDKPGIAIAQRTYKAAHNLLSSPRWAADPVLFCNKVNITERRALRHVALRA